MTAYNNLYRCPGSKRRVVLWYKLGPFCICEVCGRGPLAVYPNNTVVMHKSDSSQWPMSVVDR